VHPAAAALSALIALALLVWVALDDRRAAFALALTVGTNASAVLERDHGTQGFLLPLALLIVLIAGMRAARGAVHLRARSSPDRLVGPGLVGLVFLAAAIGPFVATDAAASASAVQQLVRNMVLVAAAVAVCRRPEGLRAGLAGLGTAGVVLATVTILQATMLGRTGTVGGFGAWTVQGLADLGPVPRAAGPFVDDPNAFAQYLLVAIAALAGSAATAERRDHRWLLAALTLWVCAGLTFTRSRSGFLALAVVGAAWLWWSLPRRRAIAVLSAAALVLLLSPLASATRLDTLTQAARPSSAADTSIAGRTSEAAAAVRMFADRPVTGVGFGAYPSEYLEYARGIGLDSRFEMRSAHSLPLEIAAEQGLLGLLAWAALVAFSASVASRLVRRRRDVGVPLALALGALAATSLFLHDVHPRAMWFLVGAVVGASWWLARPARTGRIGGGPGTVVGVPPRPDGRLLVAMVIQNYVPALGGAERQLANLAPLLRARGITPVVVTRAMAGRPTEDVIDGVRVVRIPVRGPKPLRSAAFVWQASQVLAELRPDVVHAFDTLTPSMIALRHRRRFATPVAVKLLRSGPLGDLHRLTGRPAGEGRRRRLLAEVDVFVAISRDIDAELEAFGVAADRRVRIPNGVDATRFRPRRRRSVGGPNGTAIVTGRLAPEKRIPALAARWGTVTAVSPGARLVVVGDGPDRDAIAGHGGVEVLGRRDDVAALLRGTDVYVSASAAEGLSNSLLEAMATGLACVVTDVGGVRDVITDGVDGVVVDADDLDGVADEVAALLANPVRRRRLGAAARRRVVEAYSLDATADRLVDLYRRLAADVPAVEASCTDAPCTDTPCTDAPCTDRPVERTSVGS
jgi:glycosyltransferase involved in cell wall biosynthesis/O-antigen ligase